MPYDHQIDHAHAAGVALTQLAAWRSAYATEEAQRFYDILETARAHIALLSSERDAAIAEANRSRLRLLVLTARLIVRPGEDLAAYAARLEALHADLIDGVSYAAEQAGRREGANP